jgi:ribose transport system ATP-binding protein
LSDGSGEPAGPAATLELRAIGKSFGGVPVLRGIDFTAEAGEVHALMGENGAGKSTLIKIAGGIHLEYEGEIHLDGKRIRFQGPRDATRHGIAIIHQELNLVPGLTVAENIFLGREKLRPAFRVDGRRQERDAAALLDKLHFAASPRAMVGSLRIGEQQLVEIAKALSLEARILIMDEPTSALSTSDAERLQGIIRRLARAGVAIIYISHRIEEIFLLAGRITVLRDGRLAGTLPATATSRAELIRLMAGREVQEFLHTGESGTAPPVRGQSLLSARGLWLANPRPSAARPRLLDGIDLEVGPGEVMGLAGLMGAGRTELLETLFGARGEARGGEIRIAGRPAALTSPAAAKRAGIALVTEDRKRDGLVLGAPLDANLALTVLRRLARLGFVLRGRESGLAAGMIRRLAIRTRGPRQPVGTLSGGNQQKVVLGKWLATTPRILLLDEPTRGIDVGAKAEIYRLIRGLAADGMAILLASSELPELLALSDRILVLREGRPTALLERGQFAADLILDYASPGGAVQPAFAAAAALPQAV